MAGDECPKIYGTITASMRAPTLAAIATAIATMTLAADQRRESSACQTDIVSATVVSTYCGHHDNGNEVLDLVVLWRGKPGWFLGVGQRGTGGSRTFGPGMNGIVSARETYGDVTIEFTADFDQRVATIGSFAIDLAKINTVAIDDIEGARKLSASAWTEPRLPADGDWNRALARKSVLIREFLQCDVPMPATSRHAPPVVTVCERLRR